MKKLDINKIINNNTKLINSITGNFNYIDSENAIKQGIKEVLPIILEYLEEKQALHGGSIKNNEFEILQELGINE